MNRRRTLSLAFALSALFVSSSWAVDGTLRVNDARLQGTHESGNILLYSPDPVQQGSSISHWDTTAFPNLLMEPAINPDLPFLGLDLTPQQMMDVGWTTGASTINVFPVDGGFFDPRAFGGAPGNPATTLGEARQNLFNAVLGAWANTLESPVDVDVLVFWTPLPCLQGVGAVLAAAGTTFIFNDPTGTDLPIANTWYHAALAEALAGQDLTGAPEDGGGDIVVLMNSDIDEECLGAGTGYYYGLDGNNPSNQVDVAPVVLHEFAHGLGFSNFTNEATGELIQGLPGVYDWYTFDQDTGKLWAEMSDAERRASARNPRSVTWTGPEVAAAVPGALDPGVPELVITSGGGADGTYPIGTASFGPEIPGAGLTAEIACLRDGVADFSLLNGCSEATNRGELAGKIALIDRGGCAFTTKVANAQEAGAVAAIIVNNAGQTPLGLGGDDPSITIPAVSVGAADGHRIRDAVCPNFVGSLGDGGRFQVETQWSTSTRSGPGVANDLTPDAEWFYFFAPNNPEVMVKVLDACDSRFGSFWFFAGGMTDVEVTITVTDTDTGGSKTYRNPLGTPFRAITDTMAFATCP